VTSIGIATFNQCVSLVSVAIPEEVTSIEKGTFSGCSNLVSVIIPNGVTSIGSSAFMGCSTLAKIRFEGATPPTVASSDTFTNVATDCVISVPVGSLEAYTTATNYPSAATYTYVEE
jgi:hypothetical protein